MKSKKVGKTKGKHIKMLANTASSKKSVEDCSTVVKLPDCNSAKTPCVCKTGCQDACKWACQSACTKYGGCKSSGKEPPTPKARKKK